MIGQIISHYRIIEKLGQGGMGVVYKAFDTKLERNVVLKVLKPEAMGNQVAKERFLREARSASVLNHSNICTIYEIDSEQERDFICMEYVEGETIKQKVAAAPLPLNDVLEFGIQIAEALREAHEHGIVHRDIKSENIMVTGKGQVKVLDFGLAKFKEKSTMTKLGTTLGTAAFMSPEQAQGNNVDHRSDVWSLGVMLYEMLTGQQPFKGDYESAIIYSILNDIQEPITALRTGVPLALESIVNKCLEKDKSERYQHADELSVDLRKSLKEISIPQGREETIEFSTEVKSKRKPAYLALAIIISILTLVIIGFFIFNPFSPEPLPQMKTAPSTSLPGMEERPTFSPDGTQLAFSWSGESGNNSDIYVKLTHARSEETLVSDPGNDFMPSWSPDGSYIAFGRISKGESGIYIIPPRGGIERKLASVDFGRFWWHTNLSWSPDSKYIAFSAVDSSKEYSNIYYINVASRKRRKLTHASDQQLIDTYCSISPDGKRLAFVRGGNLLSRNIYVVSLEGSKPEPITFGDRLIGGLTWTRDGREIIFSASPGLWTDSDLWRIYADGGSPSLVTANRTNLEHPTISSQGNLLACSQSSFDHNIWLFEIPESNDQKNIPSKLIYSTWTEEEARMSPDRKNIAYSSNIFGSTEIVICDSNGSNPFPLTSFGNANPGSPYWSPNGHKITFDSDHIEGQGDIYTISSDGGRPERITSNPDADHSPRYSIDGKWIYFNSNRSGNWQIWKIPARGGTAVPVTIDGGYVAYESMDSKWVYYTKYDSSGIWRISVEGGAENLVFDREIHWNNWSLIENGIYYIIRKENGTQVLEFYDFANENNTEIAELGDQYIYHISVSSDQRRILYGQDDRSESDIILIENFR